MPLGEIGLRLDIDATTGMRKIKEKETTRKNERKKERGRDVESECEEE